MTLVQGFKSHYLRLVGPVLVVIGLVVVVLRVVLLVMPRWVVEKMGMMKGRVVNIVRGRGEVINIIIKHMVGDG